MNKTGCGLFPLPPLQQKSCNHSNEVQVRDARTLARVAQFASHGIDPHQLLLAPGDTLVVANGGIPRDTLARRIAGATLASSLVRINASSGRLLGQWTLPDSQLSPRHIAWAAGPEQAFGSLLVAGLQAEHESSAERHSASALAVWDGRNLTLPTTDARAGGYAGDIAAGPGGGFVINAQNQGRGLWWHPAQPEQLTLVAELTEPCALVAWSDGNGVSLSAGRGVARFAHTVAGPHAALAGAAGTRQPLGAAGRRCLINAPAVPPPRPQPPPAAHAGRASFPAVSTTAPSRWGLFQSAFSCCPRRFPRHR